MFPRQLYLLEDFIAYALEESDIISGGFDIWFPLEDLVIMHLDSRATS